MRGFSAWLVVVLISLLPIAVPLGWWPGDPYGFVKWAMVGVATAAAAAVWLASSCARGSFEVRRNSINLPLLLLAAWSSLSLLWGPPLFYSFRRLSEILFLAVLYFVLAAAAGEGRRRSFLIVSSLLGMTVISILGIAHYTGFFSTVASPWGSGLGKRAYATMLNPNFLAAYIVSLLPLAISLFVFGRRRRTTLFFLASAIFSSSLCLLFTVSWGGWLAWLVAVLLLVAMASKRCRSHLFAKRLLAVLAVSAALAGSFLYANRKTVASDYSGMRFRFLYWRASLDMIRERPLAGFGLNAFWPEITGRLTDIIAADYRDGVPEVGPAETVYEGVFAHNEYLGVWLELGIAGVIAFIWLVCGFFAQAGRNLSGEDSAEEAAVNVGAVCGMAAMLAQSIVSYPLRLPATTVSCAVLLALVGSGAASGRRRIRIPLSAPARCVAAVAILAAAAALLPRLTYPLIGETRYVAARRASFRGDWDEVAAKCGEALAYPLTEPEVYDLVADARERLGSPREALEALRAKIAFKPHDVVAHLKMGKLYSRLGMVGSARWCFEKAMRLERHDSPEGRVHLAAVLEAQGRPGEALNILEEGLGRYARNWMLRNSLGIAYARRGERERAAGEFVAGRECGGDGVCLYNLGVLRERGRAAGGFIGPAEYDWIRERIERGREAMRKGDNERAREEFQSVLARYPDYVPALSNMGIYCMRLHRMEEALALWKRATLLDPQHRIDPL